MAHMNPERGGGTGRTLLDQLIEGEMIPHPTEPGLAGLRIRHTDVGRFTLQMLRLGRTTDGPVEGWAAVARIELDGDPSVLAQGLQNGFAQAPDIRQNFTATFIGPSIAWLAAFFRWMYISVGTAAAFIGPSIARLAVQRNVIVDALRKGRGGVLKLLQREMFSKFHTDWERKGLVVGD